VNKNVYCYPEQINLIINLINGEDVQNLWQLPQISNILCTIPDQTSSITTESEKLYTNFPNNLGRGLIAINLSIRVEL
jgi:hypothetical protein